jgi:very-short-patch-repair endonuclease
VNRAIARELRNNPTDAERFLWSHLRLRQLGGHKFRRQQPLGPYIVDFVCLEQRLIVEVDGGQHTEQQSYDMKRDAWLRDQKFIVLRFWDHEVLRQVDDVKEAIWSASSQPPL